MNLTIFFLTIGCIQVSAAAFSQKITLNEKNAPISRVLHSIQAQSGYEFFYNTKVLQAAEKVTISVKNATVEETLEELFKDGSFTYTIENNTIIIKANPLAKPLAVAVSGAVSEEEGLPLAGVTVKEKNGAGATVTDNEGKYKINVRSGAILLFSYIGYQTQEVAVGNRAVVNVTLRKLDSKLNEVVVTALGISRERRSIGYASQQLKGADLDEAKDPNFVNALAGKVAGANIAGNSTGIGGSARIVLRGEKSLNLANNQPLFVVDGVPISDKVVGFTTGQQDLDFGNAAGLVNADDVESVSVLKGANAAALYGSRAANGAILITTKSGKGIKGFEVEANSTTSLENPLRLPSYQNKYGVGSGGVYVNGSVASFGPEMTGQLLPQFDSPLLTANGGPTGLLAGDVAAAAKLGIVNGQAQPTPFVSHPNNVKDFFVTGVTATNNVSLASTGKTDNYRLSYTNLYQKGTVPNTDLARNTLSFNSSFRPIDKLTINFAANYIHSYSKNRPQVDYGNENPVYLVETWFGRSRNIHSYRNYWQPGLVGTQQFSPDISNNPYFIQYQNLNGLNADRLFGNASLRYEVTRWVSIQARTGVDWDNELRTVEKAYSTGRFKNGYYQEQKINDIERNTDLNLFFKKPDAGDFELSGTVGGNLRSDKNSLSNIAAPSLLFPGLYSLLNSNGALTVDPSTGLYEKRVNSAYASAQVGFKKYLYLEVTGRNDWSSALTLPKGIAGTSTNSYFYPSVTLSAIVSDLVTLPRWWNYAKIRGGYSQVGNDTDPYSFNQVFVNNPAYGNTPSYSETSNISNFNLKPEITSSFEAGTEWHFLGDRVNVDLTYYNTLSKNQILTLPLSNASGYDTRTINAGEVRNYGIEAMLTLIPFKGAFKWEINNNFSLNRSRVEKLVAGVSTYQLPSYYDISNQARVGEPFGQIYGIGYQRVTDPKSPYNNQVIYGANGLPLATQTAIRLGNSNPNWIYGLNNSVSYHHFYLSFLFDTHFGGNIFSYSNIVWQEAGDVVQTLQGRQYNQDITDARTGITGPGVVQNTNGSYSPNTTKVSSEFWFRNRQQGRTLVEPYVYDATYVKLRELIFGYTFRSDFLQRRYIKSARFALVGRNLFLWSKLPNADPESLVYEGGKLIPGTEASNIPSSRSIGFQLSVKF